MSAAILHRWKRDLLLIRIREINDAKMFAFMDAEGMFYGCPDAVRGLIGDATRSFEADNLRGCEVACEEAELYILKGARTFRRKHKVRPDNIRTQRARIMGTENGTNIP